MDEVPDCSGGRGRIDSAVREPTPPGAGDEGVFFASLEVLLPRHGEPAHALHALLAVQVLHTGRHYVTPPIATLATYHHDDVTSFVQRTPPTHQLQPLRW